MELQSIEKSALMKVNNLDPNQYTVSLLKEAFRIGLVDKNIIDSIQIKIVLLLKDLIMRYTKGESTSVTVETAEKILNSIYYSIDAYIKSFDTPGDSIDILKEKSIDAIYEEGIKIVKACFEESKSLYEEVLKKKLNVPLIAYNTTIDNALPDFFKNYGIIFNAHDTMADIDYPLAFDDMSIRGIFYIKQYLDKLFIENEFCNKFNKEDIERVLLCYGGVYRIEYREDLINIFEILLSNSVFSIMSGSNSERVVISKVQYELLERKLRSLNRCQIEALVDECLREVINDLCIEDCKLANYICRYNAELRVRILNAVENGSLHNIIITDDIENTVVNSIAFEEGNRMADYDFRNMTGRIINCLSIKDKINIITSCIGSAEDFIDMLQADCLFGEEYAAVFSVLNNVEISLVGRRVFREELRNGRIDISSVLLGKKETEYEWQYRYIRFLQGLSKVKIRSIERFINL